MPAGWRLISRRGWGMTTTLLLLPWGNNNGHVVRCGALGSAVVELGMSVVIPVVNRSQKDVVEGMNCTSVVYQARSVPPEYWSV